MICKTIRVSELCNEKKLHEVKLPIEVHANFEDSDTGFESASIPKSELVRVGIADIPSYAHAIEIYSGFEVVS